MFSRDMAEVELAGGQSLGQLLGIDWTVRMSTMIVSLSLSKRATCQESSSNASFHLNTSVMVCCSLAGCCIFPGLINARLPTSSLLFTGSSSSRHNNGKLRNSGFTESFFRACRVLCRRDDVTLQRIYFRRSCHIDAAFRVDFWCDLAVVQRHVPPDDCLSACKGRTRSECRERAKSQCSYRTSEIPFTIGICS